MRDLEHAKARLLRTCCVIAGALGGVMLVVGALPGTAIYKDARNCFGRAVAGIFSHGSSGGACEPSYVVDRTERVLEHPVGWLAIVGILLFGVIVWYRPKLRYALMWSLVTVGLGVLALAATFELHLFERCVQLWPAHVFGVAAVALFSLLIAILPVACGVFAWVTRTRPTPPPEVPCARIVER